ncbi:hypothetical protein ACS0TY_016785 [Phlomoides rotata]
MDSYFPSKLKRKDLENVNDDFSDFSLSSPARKIRRLDADLPPIIEEEDCEIPPVFDHSFLHEQRFDYNSSGGIKIEELPDELSNEERAIVLFKPVNTPLVHSPADFSVSMSPELLAGLKKNQLLRSSQTNSWRLAGDEAVENCASNGCRAVVPWVPSQNCSASEPVSELSSQINNIEMMEEEEEEVEESRMDVEDGNEMMEQGNVNGSGGMSLTEGFNQWQQQQHCFIPQPPPQNAKAPIVWYR